jgi:hypothetical protein
MPVCFFKWINFATRNQMIFGPFLYDAPLWSLYSYETK